jgi:hypothetical protein
MRRIPPRTIERQPCELDCSIEATDSTAERKAVLRNLSQTGARLEGSELEGCPETFELRIVHTTGAVERVNARCIWRTTGVIGVKFENVAAAQTRRPKLSYSRAV